MIGNINQVFFFLCLKLSNRADTMNSVIAQHLLFLTVGVMINIFTIITEATFTLQHYRFL